MANTNFYDRFKEKFMEWFDERDVLTQCDMIEEVFGHPVKEHQLFDKNEDLEEVVSNIADDFTGEQWYQYCCEENKKQFSTLSGLRYDMSEMVKDILTDVADMDWDFADEFCDMYTEEILQYDDAEGFFRDLQTGGCQSGCIGGLIYYSDIRPIYIKYMDSIDQYIAELEVEIGGKNYTILDIDKQPRFNYAVWMVFEEFAYRIYTALFED